MAVIILNFSRKDCVKYSYFVVRAGAVCNAIPQKL